LDSGAAVDARGLVATGAAATGVSAFWLFLEFAFWAKPVYEARTEAASRSDFFIMYCLLQN
jgi:hypothetical protein